MELPVTGKYLLACLAFAIIAIFRFKRRPRYPPGPKGLPLVGNLWDIPTAYAWIKYREIGAQLGSDIIHFEVLGSHYVVLNSDKAVKEILDKRAHIYSDRPQTVMLQELTGWHRNWALLEYGDYWKDLRRIFSQYFRPSAVPQYHSKQVKAVRRFLNLLLDSPDDFSKHIRYLAGSAILDVVYGFDVRPGDPRIELVERGVHTLSDISAGVYLVDVIPALKHIPAWFPGASFKRRAAGWKALVDAVYEVPYIQFKDSMREGSAKPCFAGTLLSEADAGGDLDETFRCLTGTAYVGGADTGSSTLLTFMLAMTLFPETQGPAHEELDRVLGRKRLPDIQDRDALPYITAMLYEVLRWHPVAPLTLPHRLMVDDEYEGYHIPAGTVVFGNAWAILHDPSTYANPDAYAPARYLTADGTALRADAPYPLEGFGFGRRVCPGRPFAHDILWLAVAHILAVFRVERAAGAEVGEVPHGRMFTPGLISVPEPFGCRFVPRFSGAEQLIRQSAMLE